MMLRTVPTSTVNITGFFQRMSGRSMTNERTRAAFSNSGAKRPWRRLVRRATADEMAIGRQFLESMAAEKSPQPKDGATPPLTLWEAYAQALLLSNEFVFVD